MMRDLFALILFIVLLINLIRLMAWIAGGNRYYRPRGGFYIRPHMHWFIGPRPPMFGPRGPMHHRGPGFGPGPGFGGPRGFSGGHSGGSFGGSSRGAGAGRH